MSGFQTYLDSAEKQTGLTPRQFLEQAETAGLHQAKVSAIITWLKTEHGLGHGHAANLAQLISKGPDAIAEKYNDGVALRLDGVTAETDG